MLVLAFASGMLTRKLKFIMSYEDFALAADTTGESERVYFKLLRKKSSAEKLKMVASINKSTRTLVLISLRERYPLDSEAEIKIKLASILYGEQIGRAFAEKLSGPPNG